MDVSDIAPQLQQLEKELDHAQDVLKPFLGDLNAISSKLPLLDKAKFFVLVTYTIESLLFCKSLHLIVSWNSHMLTLTSGPAHQRCRCQEPPRFHRDHPRPSVLREDQEAGGAASRAGDHCQ